MKTVAVYLLFVVGVFLCVMQWLAQRADAWLDRAIQALIALGEAIKAAKP